MICLVTALFLAQAILDPPPVTVTPADAPAYVVDPPPAPAPAAEIPGVKGVTQIPPGKEIDWATQTAREAWVAAKDGNWGLLVSILLMAALSLFSLLFVRSKEIRDQLRDYMPEVALIVSVLGYVAVALQALPPGAALADWWEVIGPAIKTGAAAVGAYEVIVKRLVQVWAPKLWGLAKRGVAWVRRKLFPVKA